MAIRLDFEGPVAVATWEDGENRVNPDSLAELAGVLDAVEAREAPRALVLTGQGKFFSNGLDLERFLAAPAELSETLEGLLGFIARLATAPFYSVAALNGHTFAAGALLSMAFDYRVMREDRGYWCMNEAQVGMALDERFLAVLTNRMPRSSALHAVLTAQRYGGPEARAAGIVEATAPEGEVLARAVEQAALAAALDPTVLAANKRLFHAPLVAALGLA